MEENAIKQTVAYIPENQENGQNIYQTKGDNNNVEDFVLAQEQNVIGEVIYKIPKLGYVQALLASKGGLIIIVLIPCLAILSYDIVKLGRNIGKKKKKEASNVTVVRR